MTQKVWAAMGMKCDENAVNVDVDVNGDKMRRF